MRIFLLFLLFSCQSVLAQNDSLKVSCTRRGPAKNSTDSMSVRLNEKVCVEKTNGLKQRGIVTSIGPTDISILNRRKTHVIPISKIRWIEDSQGITLHRKYNLYTIPLVTCFFVGLVGATVYDLEGPSRSNNFNFGLTLGITGIAATAIIIRRTIIYKSLKRHVGHIKYGYRVI
ncbi:MAG: hypothetical protein ACRCYO_00710 [Bacteroidia bacterium]